MLKKEFAYSLLYPTGVVGITDPEVAIVFGTACSMVGYPPWQLRLTEIQ